MLANIGRVKAQDIIHRGDYDAADYRAVYDLWLTAYGDQQLAERAKVKALAAYVERQCKR